MQSLGRWTRFVGSAHVSTRGDKFTDVIGNASCDVHREAKLVWQVKIILASVSPDATGSVSLTVDLV